MTPLPSAAKGLTMVSLGNKLFITSIIDYLVSTGVIQGVVGGLGSRAQRSGPPCSADIHRWEENMNRWEMVGTSDVVIAWWEGLLQ